MKRPGEGCGSAVGQLWGEVLPGARAQAPEPKPPPGAGSNRTCANSIHGSTSVVPAPRGPLNRVNLGGLGGKQKFARITASDRASNNWVSRPGWQELSATLPSA